MSGHFGGLCDKDFHFGHIHSVAFVWSQHLELEVAVKFIN